MRGIERWRMEEERTMKGGWRTMRRDVADTDNQDNLGMRVGITCRITNEKKVGQSMDDNEGH